MKEETIKTTELFPKAIRDKIIYMNVNDKFKTLRHLEYSVESLLELINVDGIGRKEKKVLTRAYTNFFARNFSLDAIQEKKFFMFNQYPIALINANGDEQVYSLTNGYVTYEKEDQIRLRTLNFVARFSIVNNLFEQPIDYVNLIHFASELLNILNVNDKLTEHLFSFYLDEMTEDKILIDTKYVDVIETKNLFDEDDGDDCIGLYSWEVYKRTLQFEENMSHQSKFQVIMHELLHGVFETTGMFFSEISERLNNDDHLMEEEITHRLAHSLSTFVMDNQSFVLRMLNDYAVYDVPTDAELLEKRHQEMTKDLLELEREIEKNKKDRDEINKGIELLEKRGKMIDERKNKEE